MQEAGTDGKNAAGQLRLGMAAAELAEAGFLLTKRLLKWAALGLLVLTALAVCVWGGSVAYQKYQDRPYRALAYVDVKLGDTQDEVFYALGEPSVVIERPKTSADAKAWEDAPVVFEVKDIPAGKGIRDYREWGYSKGVQHHWQIAFDTFRGRVTGASCYSQSTWNCPPLFGLRDGSSEEEVRSQLGVPSAEELDGSVKRLRFPEYNLSVHLEKRRVTRLLVTDGARPPQ